MAGKKAAPFLGPHSQKRQVRKESGKAMQGTDPESGSAQRRLRKLSEGQFVGGLFHCHGKGAFAEPNLGVGACGKTILAKDCNNWSYSGGTAWSAKLLVGVGRVTLHIPAHTVQGAVLFLGLRIPCHGAQFARQEMVWRPGTTHRQLAVLELLGGATVAVMVLLD
jgi:hypothetical protein